MQDCGKEGSYLWIDCCFGLPEKNIEFDEYLLTLDRPVFRVWESSSVFVVLGRATDESEVNWSAVSSDKIAVVRRFSGGGVVLQGPGCINYTYVGRLKDRLYPVNKVFEDVLNIFVEGFDKLFGLDVCIRGTSDLCISDRKFSGNAQRRYRSRFYVHGTILYDFDIDLIERYLRHPYKEPEYRRKRSHRDFLTNLPLGREDVVKLLRWVCRNL